MHQRIIIKNDKSDLPLSYISKTIIENNLITSLHTHPNLEILLITKGEGNIVSSNDSYDVKENDLVIINPNTMHCENGENLEFYALGLSNMNVFSKSSFKDNIIKISLENNEYDSFFCIYNLIFNEAKNENHYEIIKNSFNSFLVLLDNRTKIVSSKNNTNISNEVLTAKNIIDNYYYENIKTEDIAKKINVSVSSLSHKFKKELSKTLIEYKIEKQLDEAMSLLINTNMQIYEISSFVGFNNISYFNKCFYKKYKITPKKYRQKGK